MPLSLEPLTEAEANAPKPKPPKGIRDKDWFEYYIDLACWRATQAEKLLSGVEKQEK